MATRKVPDTHGYPADAGIIADLLCTSCGYNLRGNVVGGRCPECGDPVAQSLTGLTDPDAAAEQLPSLGRWYLVLYVAALLLLLGAWVMISMAVVSSAGRLMALRGLRRVGGLGDARGTGARLWLAWWLGCVELIVAVCAGVVAFMWGSSPAVQSNTDVLAAAVAFFAMVNAFVAAWMAMPVARRWGRRRVLWELRIAAVLIAAGPFAAALAALIAVWLKASSAEPAIICAFGCWVVGLWVLWIALEHMGRLAEQKRGVPPGIVEDLREPLLRSDRLPDKPTPGPIPLEPATEE
ncbi:MAG: hypothetical protein KAS72_06555 [Phycisphaerales bacterium]|nr:hypothetical protein [Phycisphaerales bacterium]